MLHRRTLFLSTLALMCSAACAYAAPPAPPEPDAGWEAFDAYAARALEQWKVPGMAIAVIEGDEVVFARGYGVQDIETGAPVRPETVFSIGSVTKPFTAAAAGMLVEEGVLGWDEPIQERLPELELHDQALTSALSLRDTLSHRTGHSRMTDLLWYFGEIETKELLHRLRFFPAHHPFRSRFGYQNAMYAVAGEVVARADGRSWDEAIQARLLHPLGMRSTTTRLPAPETANVATPHALVDDTLVRVPPRDIGAAGPAGSMCSNVLDMARWVRVHLQGGRLGEERILPEAVVEEMRQAQVFIRPDAPEAAFMQGANLRAYGLGWFLHDYHGDLVVQHGGGIDGMRALVTLLPGKEAGLVVLTNREDTWLPEVMAYRFYDLVLEREESDWSTQWRKAYDGMQAGERAYARQFEEAKDPARGPSAPLSTYVGAYRDDLLGEMRVEEDAEGLVLRYGKLRAKLEPWRGDRFRATFADRRLGRTWVDFRVDEGRPSGLSSTIYGALVSLERVEEAAEKRSRAP